MSYPPCVGQAGQDGGGDDCAGSLLSRGRASDRVGGGLSQDRWPGLLSKRIGRACCSFQAWRWRNIYIIKLVRRAHLRTDTCDGRWP